MKPRRAPTRRSHPGQGGGRRENGLTRGAKLRSGRAGRLPASPTVFEREWLRSAHSGAHDGPIPAVRETLIPGPCVRRSLRASRGKGSAPGGKQRSCSGVVAPAAVEREPTRKQEARESGYGSSRGESSGGHFQGRERHGTRPRSFGASRKTACLARGAIRSAFAARTVERGKNPEDGTDEGSAKLSSTATPAQLVGRGKGHPT